MKILIVTDYHNRTWIGSYNYTLYRGLQQQWHEVEIVNLVSKQGYKSVPAYGVNLTSYYTNIQMIQFAVGVFRTFRRKLSKHLATHQYDFVLIGHQGLAYLYDVVKKHAPVFGIAVMDLFTLYKDLRDNKLFNFIYNRSMLHKLRKFDHILCISHFTLRDYKKLVDSSPSKHIVAIHNGFDITPVALSPQEKDSFKQHHGIGWKKIILHVWSEEERKNIMTFFKVAAHYKNDNELLFVRVWRQSPVVKEFIETHGLKNIVYFAGLSDEELNKFYSVSDLYLYTSTLEGFGRPLVEAYLNHLICISSKVSDMEEIFATSKNVHFVSDPFAVDEYISLVEQHRNDTYVLENIDLSSETEIHKSAAFIQESIERSHHN